MIHQIAAVSRAERSNEGVLSGYQRPEVSAHIRDIYNYLSSEKAILPNAIVLAFDGRVTFSPLRGATLSEWGTFGILQIPLPKSPAALKAGFIVDGQQRVAALSRLDPKKPFPVVVTAFVTTVPAMEREQFMLINRTKPLPRDLINELLPEIEVPLPARLASWQVASKILKRLRFDKQSPFYQRIRGIGPKNPGANVSQNAVLSVVQNSIRQKGVLYDTFHEAGDPDYDAMADTLSLFFNAVRRVWPEAWAGSPKTSRLVHGVGIVAMGNLMDRVMRDVDGKGRNVLHEVEVRLRYIEDSCAWMEGSWPEPLACSWDALQNTSIDKSKLTLFILKVYQAKCRKSPAR